ncbi:TIGR02646 family protein [Halomonas sp. CnH100-B]|jgi:uncharacterized protein (TIGR02646 family)|uniref:retron system putative HNH endonuclease n=1 Tax=Halomonas sp. CnH100-B TaxID=2954490 RepID=UPI002096D066|nr:retron system putative HNH endonuclease [Halomonas sp. CnH100-B]MCO7229227.1 TIGR02646 family protein [Halomonas sp. CnH100-B]
MRHITKQGSGGHHLQKAHLRPPQTNQEATSRWRSFNHKQKVLESLLEEQYQLCCYSELRSDHHELGYHIEHIENKGQAPQRTFDYTNLAASALDSDRLRAFKDRLVQENLPGDFFGGHAQGKQQSVDMQRFISPHQQDCARFFAFLSDGRIVPAENLNEWDQERARYTIDLLNLDSGFLKVERQKWWDELEQLFDEHLDKDMDIDCLAAIYLLPISQGLNPFFTLTRKFFGRIAEQVLQQDAPELL